MPILAYGTHLKAHHRTLKISATLKGNPDSEGRRKVHIRIADGDKRTFRATNLRVADADFEKGKVKSSHPRYKEYNSIIAGKIKDAETSSSSAEEAELPQISFYRFAEGFISTIERKRSSETVRQYHSELRKLKGFKETITLSRIDTDFLNGYSAYCYRQGNKENTVWKTFKFLRMIIKRALLQKKINENPFLFFEMPKYEDPEKVYLTREQVGTIDKYCMSKECPPELSFIGTWFLISCWTGFRYSDCRRFDKKKIKGTRLVIYTQKTGKPVSLPFNDRLKNLFERIEYKPLHFTNEHVNRVLKIICDACNIDPLSYHASRHTFGVMAASSGIRREIIAKIMGHSDLRTTAIYAKLTGDTVDDEYSKLK